MISARRGPIPGTLPRPFAVEPCEMRQGLSGGARYSHGRKTQGAAGLDRIRNGRRRPRGRENDFQLPPPGLAHTIEFLGNIRRSLWISTPGEDREEGTHP